MDFEIFPGTNPFQSQSKAKTAAFVARSNRSYPGLNFFSAEDQRLFEALARGEFNLRGFQNKSLRAHRGEKSSGQVSRLLQRLRLHGLVKKVGHTYRYYLTVFGKQVIASGLKLKNLFLIPQLALAAINIRRFALTEQYCR